MYLTVQHDTAHDYSNAAAEASTIASAFVSSALLLIAAAIVVSMPQSLCVRFADVKGAAGHASQLYMSVAVPKPLSRCACRSAPVTSVAARLNGARVATVTMGILAKILLVSMVSLRLNRRFRARRPLPIRYTGGH